MSTAELAVKQRLQRITITDTAAQGNTLVKWHGKVIFIRGGAVGDIADIEINAVHSHYAKATVVQVHTPGPDRVSAKCQHYHHCGGCQLQHIDYPAQQSFIQTELENTLRKISGLKLPKLSQYHPAPQQWQSRNKLSFAFTHNAWQTVSSNEKHKAIGFHKQDAPTDVIAIERCHLMPAEVSKFAREFAQAAQAAGLSFWNHAKQQGLLREFIVRSNQQQQYMIVLHVSYESEALTELGQALFNKYTQIVSVFVAVNRDKTQDMRDAELIRIAGADTLQDTLGDQQFLISPKAFYQTNSQQAARLFERVRAMARISHNDTVYDLYCGTGTIAISVAAAAKKVVGIELVADAIDDAQQNAKLNNCTNVSFHCGRAETLITKQFIKANGKPDVVIVDPPRAGLDQALCQQLQQLAPKRLVYVSCDPATQARDFQRLHESFEVSAIEAVDMFAHSYHCETVALLSLRKKPQAKPKRGLKY